MVLGPQAGKDPIVLAAEFVVVAQTIVSRQIDPQQPAVLTVGTIHGGTKNNIIPDEVAIGDFAADLLATPSATRLLRTFDAPQMGWRRPTAFRRIACLW